MASVPAYSQFIWSILVVSWLPSTRSCSLEGLQICGSNEELKRSPVAVMFSEGISEYKMTCLRQKEFMSCAANWREKESAGCSQRDLAGLASFENVHRAVCLNNATAYNRSRSCILVVESNIHSCLRIFARAKEDHCLEMEETRECVGRSVTHKSCDDVDRAFIREITDLSLVPFAHPEAFNCEMSTFADQREKGTSPAPIATIEAETETATIKTETATIKTETATIETAAATTAVGMVSASEIPPLSDKEKAEPDDSKGRRTLRLVDDSGSCRHSTSVSRVTALFVAFLSVNLALVR